MKKRTGCIFLTVLVMMNMGLTLRAAPEHTHTGWPRRVLITNDNGIDDIRIIELARAFAHIADTYVLAPKEDQSGTGHYFTSIERGTVTLKRRDLGDKITAYAVDGFPADCVILGLGGIMRENRPDLVISGINGGANLGSDWIASGTIGAARFAAFAGVPAIAISGVHDDDPEIIRAAAHWVVAFTQTEIVRTMTAPQFLTVGIPNLPPSEIRGVRIAKRAELQETPIFMGDPGKTSERWQLKGVQPRNGYAPPADSDVALYAEGYIVVTPMQADEHDLAWMYDLRKNIQQFPGQP